MRGNSPKSALVANDVAAERQLLGDAARVAGALALEMRAQGVKKLNKEDGSPVTEADLAVNALLETRLRTERPDYAWLSEESPKADFAGARRTFVVDPIDGTADFVKGSSRWCVALALLQGDSVIASAIFNPVTDELFEAGLGLGALCNGAPLKVSDREHLEGSRLFTNPNLSWEGWPKAWPKLHVISGGSCGNRMADVAAGRADGYMSITTKWDWDMAPGALLITEAGGAVTDTRGGAFSYNNLLPKQLSVAAAPPALHAQIIARTRRIVLPLKVLSKNSVQLDPED